MAMTTREAHRTKKKNKGAMPLHSSDEEGRSHSVSVGGRAARYKPTDLPTGADDETAFDPHGKERHREEAGEHRLPHRKPQTRTKARTKTKDSSSKGGSRDSKK